MFGRFIGFDEPRGKELPPNVEKCSVHLADVAPGAVVFDVIMNACH